MAGIDIDSYEVCVRRVSNNIIPGFVQFIEILSGKSFTQLVKYGDIKNVLSKIYSIEVMDIIVKVLMRHIEEACGRDC